MSTGKRGRKQICAVLLVASLIMGSTMPVFASEGGNGETETESTGGYPVETETQEKIDTYSEYTTIENADILSDTEDDYTGGSGNKAVGEAEKDNEETDEVLSSKNDSQEKTEETQTEDSGQDFTGTERNTNSEEAVLEDDLNEKVFTSEKDSTMDISDIPEEGTTLSPVSKSVRESYGEDDSDELFAEYVDNLFDGENPSAASRNRKKAKKNVGNKFTGASQIIYSQLYSGAQEIASGQRESSTFVFSAEDLGYGVDVSWSAADLGVEDIVVDNNITNAAADSTMDIVDEQLQISSVVYTLLADCPYEFYWFDKSVGVSRQTDIGAVYSDGEWRTYISGNYIISLSVADEFAVSQYVADTGKTGAASLAVENAHDILTNNQGLTDIEKLYSYKNAICDAVSYNYDAAQGGAAYGNPWQLIWVFDGDDTTNVVCEGYSKAFQYLCDKTSFSYADMCAYSVTGIMSNASDETDGEPHMWNIVTLDDGKNYLADVTNSDSGSIGQNEDLFLVPYTSGSVYDGYSFRCNETTDILYVYDEKATELFSEEDLTIASLPYGTTPEQDPLEITLQPESVGASLEELVSLHIETNLEDVSFQWQWSTNGTFWKNCTSPGYDTDTFCFRMKEMISGRLYRCVVTLGDETVFSDFAEISLNEALFEITNHPMDVCALIGENVSLHVEANIVDVTYQWQWSTNGTSWKNCTSAGSNTDTFAFRMKEAISGRLYRCAVTYGNMTIYSNGAVISLDDTFLEITIQPQNVAAHIRDTVSLHVEANMSDVTYQWQWSTNGISWKNCTSAGYNTDTFSFIMKEALSGRIYRCAVIYDNAVIYSDSAEITLDILEIIEHPQGVNACINENVSLHVEANKSDVTYQWQWSANCISWKNCTSIGYNTDTFSFVMKEALSGRFYRCVVSDGSEKVYTETALLTLVLGTGACGDNASWTLDNRGILTISGTGDMWNFRNKRGTKYDDDHPMSWEDELDKITEVVVEEGITAIGRCAFYGATNLTSAELPSSLRELRYFAFYNCSSLQNIELPEGLQTIQQYALNYTAISRLTIPGTVRFIDSEICANCPYLESIYIKKRDVGSLTYGSGPFSDCPALTEIIVEDGHMALEDIDGVLVDRTKSIIVQYPAGKTDANFTIPEELTVFQNAFYGTQYLEHLDLSNITVIPAGAFRGCASLSSVTFSDSLTSIGDSAFRECVGLSSIILPDSVESLGGWCFAHCTSLTSIVVPDQVDSLGYYTFSYCTSLTDIALPENLSGLGYGTFENCRSLMSINIPDDITFINNYTFSGCSLLTSIIIPDGVSIIGERAFYGCTSLSSVTLPVLLESIGKLAFGNCQSLESVAIPDGVTTIGESAFSSCDQLKVVVIPISVTTIGTRAFRGCSSLNYAYNIGDVYYSGTSTQWDAINIGDENDCLLGANIHFESSGPEAVDE